MTDGQVSDAAVKLLEARIGEVADRLRLLAAERARLEDEGEALRRELRAALAEALAALGEE